MVAKINVFGQAGDLKAVRFVWTKGSIANVARVEHPHIGEVIGEDSSHVMGPGVTVALVFPSGVEQSFMVASILTNDRNHQDPLLLLNHLDEEERRFSEYKYVVLLHGFSIPSLGSDRHHYIHWHTDEGREQIVDTMYGSKSQHCFKADRSTVFEFTGVPLALASIRPALAGIHLLERAAASSSSSMPIAEWEADLDVQEPAFAASSTSDSLELAHLQVAIAAASAELCRRDQPERTFNDPLG